MPSLSVDASFFYIFITEQAFENKKVAYFCETHKYKPMNNNSRIYSGDWKSLHPYTGSAPTDLYYITLSNKVLAAIRAIQETLPEDDYRRIDLKEQKELACILTAYFEDVISQAGIFQAFTRVHNRRFGKPLPFYTLGEEYTPGEINIEEVEFLIWHYYMQLNNLDIAYSPILDTFAAMATDVMAIFECEYETAPENEKLLRYFELDEKESSNLYALHSKFLWLGTQSYLLSNNGLLLEDDAEMMVEEAKESGLDDQIPEMVNMLCNDFGFNQVTELMRLTAPQWLAEVLGEESPLYASLMSFGRKYAGYFRYEGADAQVTHFRHIASDRVLTVTNRSLVGLPREMKNPDLILYTGFVEWNDEWWLTGQITSYEESEDLLGQITGSDDEYNLFEPEEELPEEEQQIVLNDILTNTEVKEGETLDEGDLAWLAMLNDELGKEFFISQVKAGKITGLQFYQDPGHLLLDNLEFMVEYVKR